MRALTYARIEMADAELTRVMEAAKERVRAAEKELSDLFPRIPMGNLFLRGRMFIDAQAMDKIMACLIARRSAVDDAAYEEYKQACVRLFDQTEQTAALLARQKDDGSPLFEEVNPACEVLQRVVWLERLCATRTMQEVGNLEYDAHALNFDMHYYAIRPEEDPIITDDDEIMKHEPHFIYHEHKSAMLKRMAAARKALEAFDSMPPNHIRRPYNGQMESFFEKCQGFESQIHECLLSLRHTTDDDAEVLNKYMRFCCKLWGAQAEHAAILRRDGAYGYKRNMAYEIVLQDYILAMWAPLVFGLEYEDGGYSVASLHDDYYALQERHSEPMLSEPPIRYWEPV
jgi:hypothetical protein